MSELVSIGLPVRNGEETIAATVASVLAQSYGHLELNIFDNASTDGTEKVCRDLARSDPRVHYHRHPENIGLFRNSIAAADSANGGWYRLIGDDDYLEPDYVQACLDAAAADPRVVLVTTGMAYETDDGSVSTADYTGTGLGSDDPADRAAEMLRLLNESYLLIDPLYGLMRPRLFQVPRRSMLREDEILAVRFALAGPWAHVPRVLARRSWHAGNINAHARLLAVPMWQARFVNVLQARELLRFVGEAELTPQQRARARAAVYRMLLTRQRRVISRRSRKLVRLALDRLPAGRR